jgi:hypothetical protein
MTLVAENDEAHAAATATTWIACVGLMGGRGILYNNNNNNNQKTHISNSSTKPSLFRATIVRMIYTITSIN